MAQDTSNDVSWAAAALYFFNLSCTCPSVYVVDVVVAVVAVDVDVVDVVVVVVVELAVTSERGNQPQIMWFVEGGLERLGKKNNFTGTWSVFDFFVAWHLTHNYNININASTTTTATMTATTTTINGKPPSFFFLNFYALLIFCISYHNYRPWRQLTTK